MSESKGNRRIGQMRGRLVRLIPVGLLDFSLSGCLLATDHPLDAGTVGELEVVLDGTRYQDTVQVVRTAKRRSGSRTLTLGAGSRVGIVGTRSPCEPMCLHRGTVTNRSASPQLWRGSEPGTGRTPADRLPFRSRSSRLEEYASLLGCPSPLVAVVGEHGGLQHRVTALPFPAIEVGRARQHHLDHEPIRPELCSDA